MERRHSSFSERLHHLREAGASPLLLLHGRNGHRADGERTHGVRVVLDTSRPNTQSPKPQHEQMEASMFWPLEFWLPPNLCEVIEPILHEVIVVDFRRRRIISRRFV
jgi:hypothetical protein